MDSAPAAPLKIGIIDTSTFAALFAYFPEKESELPGPLAIAGLCGPRRSR